jgi:hypothetical protein
MLHGVVLVLVREAARKMNLTDNVMKNEQRRRQRRRRSMVWREQS